MELAQLEAFVQVAAHRSFSKAAEVLYLTQPSVGLYEGIIPLRRVANELVGAHQTHEAAPPTASGLVPPTWRASMSWICASNCCRTIS